MPQLCLETFFSQYFWLVVIFFFFYFFFIIIFLPKASKIFQVRRFFVRKNLSRIETNFKSHSSVFEKILIKNFDESFFKDGLKVCLKCGDKI